jgi:hypothetical protein
MGYADANPARFIRVVGWAFGAAAAIGLIVCATQSALLFQGAPGIAADIRARVVTLALVATSFSVLVVSIAFVKRRRWALRALAVLTMLGIIAGVIALLVPSPVVELPPPEAPDAYLRVLRLVSSANRVVPIVACTALGWILWRLRSPAVRDQFR